MRDMDMMRSNFKIETKITSARGRAFASVMGLGLGLALALAVTLAMTMTAAPMAQAQTYTTLHSFTGTPDGQFPYSGVVQDSEGNFYGTTQGGGASNFGTVFKVNANGKYKIIYNFSGTDGKYPSSALILDKEVLYGTTYAGGASGIGTVFKITKSGRLTTLHSFSGTPDGRFPVAGLVSDASGNLYGTTGYGGASDNGTVFVLNAKHKTEVSILYSFSGAPDGANPFASLIVDPSGNLYGVTTSGGASGLGTVFSVTPSGQETVLHSFSGYPGDGAAPYYAALTRDSSGNLYGTTWAGGSSLGVMEAFGGGIAFQLTPSGTENILWNFCSVEFCYDGSNPTGGLVQSSDGNFYGTTAMGYWYGALFSLTSGGNEEALYWFEQNALGGNTGGFPAGPLVMDQSGTLYGTTTAGGSTGNKNWAGLGSVYSFVP
jgi:uncharacterized repeat protein (TIGR03803 family)